jgi:hypothetical protein
MPFILTLRVLAVYLRLVGVSWMLDHKRRSLFVNIGAMEFNVNRGKYLIFACFYFNFKAASA